LDNRLLSAAQQRKTKFSEDLATLVNLDSGTEDAKGLAQVEKFLKQRLKRLGAKVEILPLKFPVSLCPPHSPAPPAAGKIVLGTLQGSGTKNIMLMIHYDTVFHRGDAARRPFKVEGNKASGPVLGENISAKQLV
jgi:glutamate carboxypeptidase